MSMLVQVTRHCQLLPAPAGSVRRQARCLALSSTVQLPTWMPAPCASAPPRQRRLSSSAKCREVARSWASPFARSSVMFVAVLGRVARLATPQPPAQPQPQQAGTGINSLARTCIRQVGCRVHGPPKVCGPPRLHTRAPPRLKARCCESSRCSSDTGCSALERVEQRTQVARIRFAAGPPTSFHQLRREATLLVRRALVPLHWRRGTDLFPQPRTLGVSIIP